MRFVTEFELNEYTNDPGYLANKKYERGMNLGKLIADSFGWEEIAQTTNFLNTTILHKCTLAIEAFPIDKWIEFKNKLMGYLTECEEKDELPETLWVLKTIKELESFGKPSGDTITNLSDHMEYRGSSTHCKACEDEAAGIKHIQAQRHTCKFKR